MTANPATCGDCVNRGYVTVGKKLQQINPATGFNPFEGLLYECRISCAKITYDDPACVNFNIQYEPLQESEQE